VVPVGQPSGFRAGMDMHVGTDQEEKREVLAQLGDIYIFVGGGPSVAQEARAAWGHGAAVVPLPRTGGASSGRFDFPREALRRPACATEEEWSSFSASDTPVKATVAAAVRIIGRLAEAVRRDEGQEEEMMKRESSMSARRRRTRLPSATPAPSADELRTALTNLSEKAKQHLSGLEGLQATVGKQAVETRQLGQVLECELKGLLRAWQHGFGIDPPDEGTMNSAAQVEAVLVELDMMLRGGTVSARRSTARPGRHPQTSGKDHNGGGAGTGTQGVGGSAELPVDDVERLLALWLAALKGGDVSLAVEATERSLPAIATIAASVEEGRAEAKESLARHQELTESTTPSPVDSTKPPSPKREQAAPQAYDTNKAIGDESPLEDKQAGISPRTAPDGGPNSENSEIRNVMEPVPAALTPAPPTVERSSKEPPSFRNARLKISTLANRALAASTSSPAPSPHGHRTAGSASGLMKKSTKIAAAPAAADHSGHPSLLLSGGVAPGPSQEAPQLLEATTASMEQAPQNDTNLDQRARGPPLGTLEAILVKRKWRKLAGNSDKEGVADSGAGAEDRSRTIFARQISPMSASSMGSMQSIVSGTGEPGSALPGIALDRRSPSPAPMGAASAVSISARGHRGSEVGIGTGTVMDVPAAQQSKFKQMCAKLVGGLPPPGTSANLMLPLLQSSPDSRSPHHVPQLPQPPRSPSPSPGMEVLPEMAVRTSPRPPLMKPRGPIRSVARAGA